MSDTHVTLQRVVVRMLYDRPFAEAVFADPQTALQGPLCSVQLPEEAVGWLTAIDRRAFTTDPLRRTRSLTALLDEYPVAGAWVISARGASGGILGGAALDSFFSSPAFHRCIQHRGVLALAFGTWLRLWSPLEGAEGTALRALVDLELAFARLRRAQPRAVQDGALYQCSPLVQPLTLAGGGLQLYSAVKAALDALGAEAMTAVLKGQFPRPATPALDRAQPEYLLVEGRWPEDNGAGPEGEISLSLGGGSQALNALLDGLNEAPQNESEAISTAASAGADEGQALELIRDLVEEGLLVRV
ncbi:MAG: hypothetical protein ACE366_29665 [Bradymonadia bacterium]